MICQCRPWRGDFIFCSVAPYINKARRKTIGIERQQLATRQVRQPENVIGTALDGGNCPFDLGPQAQGVLATRNISLMVVA